MSSKFKSPLDNLTLDILLNEPNYTSFFPKLTTTQSPNRTFTTSFTFTRHYMNSNIVPHILERVIAETSHMIKCEIIRELHHTIFSELRRELPRIKEIEVALSQVEENLRRKYVHE